MLIITQNENLHAEVIPAIKKQFIGRAGKTGFCRHGIAGIQLQYTCRY